MSFTYTPAKQGIMTSDSVVVVCEPQHEVSNLPMSIASLQLLQKVCASIGIPKDKLLLIQQSPPIPVEIKNSEARKREYLEPYLNAAKEFIDSLKPKLLVTLGDSATKFFSGKSTKFSAVRGTIITNNDYTIFPMTSPGQALIRPESMPTFIADLTNLKNLLDNGLEVSTINKEYRWCEDISFLLSNPPTLIAIDIETTGLEWRDLDTKILTIQITYRDHESLVCPIDPQFWDWKGRGETRINLINQIKLLLENPKVKKIGQNITYDLLMLELRGYKVRGVLADTELWAWGVDENVLQKNIDNLCKIYVPEYAGYNDKYNSSINKSDMINLDKDSFLDYAGGDTAATFALFKVLDRLLKQMPTQYKLITKVKMPCLMLLKNMTRKGVEIDNEYLSSLEPTLKEDLDRIYKELLELSPKKILQYHLDKGLSFTRDALVRDILFSPDGFGLKPILFTKSTADLTDPSERVPSASANNHLPFFINAKGNAGKFVTKFMEYTKLEKLLSTYVTGFVDKYAYKGAINSSFSLSRTVTGRTASSNPNSQNWPSRGKYSKLYKKAFKAREGYTFVTADLSQIELRLIAHEANEPNMIKLYREDADIHTNTAIDALRISKENWDELPKEQKSFYRRGAKAINFGFVYGMSARKFITYAKTDYNVEYTLEEGRRLRDTFFNVSYPSLPKWHTRRINEVNENGYVVSLVGHIRHLPGIYSTENGVKAAAERQSINSGIQGTGSDLGLYALLRIARQGNPYIKPILFIHDDDVMEVKEGYEWEAANALCWVMRNHRLKELFGIDLSVPIKGEPDVGKTLGTMYELGGLPDDAPDWVKAIPKVDTMNPSKPTWWDDKKDI